MAYAGKYELKLQAQALRKLGLSYSEIQQSIMVTKDTLSRWCKEIELSKEQRTRLMQLKNYGQRKGSLVAAENKRKKRKIAAIMTLALAYEQIGEVTQRERFIAGIALYAGEGDKGPGKTGFANSDPKLILFMMRWFREFVKVPEGKFRGAIWLHEGLDEERAKQYWSGLTGIPPNQFHKTYISQNKVDSRKIRKKLHNYGIFSIRFSDTQKQRLILSWISAVFLVKSDSSLTIPDSSMAERFAVK